MKNKGFTLVELLAVIVILGVLITIAVPNIIKTSKTTRETMYENKVKMIEKAAEIYGEDNHETLSENGTKKMTIKELLDNNYLKKDDKNCTSDNGCIKDPRDNTSMDNKKVCICLINKRPTAVFIGDSTNCNDTICNR